MKYLTIVLAGAALVLGVLLWIQRGGMDARDRRIAARERSIATLTAQRDSLAKALAPQLVTAERWRTQWDTSRVTFLEHVLDSLRRAGVAHPESVLVPTPVYVLGQADTTVRSCFAALGTCRAQLHTDSLLVDSLRADVTDWKAKARGPLLRPSAELLFSGSHPRAAAQLEAGRRLSAVARLEVDTLPRIWAGVRYQF